MSDWLQFSTWNKNLLPVPLKGTQTVTMLRVSNQIL